MDDFEFNKDDIVYVINQREQICSTSYNFIFIKLLCRANDINIDLIGLDTDNIVNNKMKIIESMPSLDNIYLVYEESRNKYYGIYEAGLSDSPIIDIEDKDKNIELENMQGVKINSVKKGTEDFKIPNPKQIKEYLDQYIIGQEEAKMLLSTAVHNHYLRTMKMTGNNDVEISKSNILMIGNSGTGKTLLAQTIAKYLQVPFVMINATEFSPTGIVGKSAEDIIQKLLDVAGGSVKRAEKGIVYIDEIDKIAEGGSLVNKQFIGGNATMGKEIQGTFLKLLEGTEISCRNQGMFGMGEEHINTKNILFICGGAFAGIESLIKQDDNIQRNHIGFNAKINKINKNNSNKNLIRKISQEEIIKYGMMPELVGRLPIIVRLDTLEVKDLVQILTEPKNALIKQYTKILEMDGLKVKFNKNTLEYIAKLAIERKIGARGLRSIIEPFINRIQFNAPNDGRIRECVIDLKSFKNNIIPTLKK